MTRYWRVFLALCCFIGIGDNASYDRLNEWKDYKTTFNKYYADPIEEQLRYKAWLKMDDFLKTVDQAQFKMNHNWLSDKLPEDDKNIRGYKRPENQIFLSFPIRDTDLKKNETPASFNWVDQGWNPPVKRQGTCGACYAFSVAGVLEFHVWNLTGKMISLSEQQIVDCSFPYGNNGCKGGHYAFTYNYVEYEEGLVLNAYYPYRSATGQCHYSKSKVAVKIETYKYLVDRRIEELMQHAVYQYGPLNIALFSHIKSFEMYSGGLYNDTMCRGPVDHGLILVGFGTTEIGEKYWLLRNSWGSGWGMQGYMKLARGVQRCAIGMDVYVPVGVSVLIDNVYSKAALNLHYTIYTLFFIFNCLTFILT